MNLRRLAGISYNAAWRMKHTLMQVMLERNNHQGLMGRVEIDDAYRGGEKHGGHRGRGSENKAPFIAAVQTDKAHHPLYMCFKAVSDGVSGFKGIEDAGCHHMPVVTGGGYQSMNNEQFSWVNTLPVQSTI